MYRCPSWTAASSLATPSTRCCAAASAGDGRLTEGTHSSLFGVKDGVLVTAPNGPDILPGTTRRLLFRLAAKIGAPIEERMLHRDELPQVAELFLSGTTSEVLPIVRVDGRPVGAGEPGPITRRLQLAYRE